MFSLNANLFDKKITFIIELWAVSSPSSCHLRELELCTVGAASIFQNPNGIPLKPVELKRQCEYLEESVGCYEEFAENCLTKHVKPIVSLFSGDIKSLQREFCTEGTNLRKDYMKFGPCLKEVQRKYQRVCVEDLQAGFENIHKLNISLRLSTTCCNVNRFKSCILDRVDEICGSEAYDFVMKLIRRVASNAMGILCRHYDNDFDGCALLLPEPGTKPHAGRNTSAISRVISSYSNARA